MLNRIIANSLPYFPQNFVWLFSKRYIAGKSIDDGITISRSLNEKGIWVTVDLLGEFIHTIEEAEANKDAYLNIIDQFNSEFVKGTYSLKPTSFGLLINKDRCYEFVREVVLKAASIHNFVRIDMEDASCTDMEIELFIKLKKEFPMNVGIVFQAYLNRTESDIKNLIKHHHTPEAPLNIRLCKGIYVEDKSIAIKDYEDIRQNYLKLLHLLLDHKVYTGIATHDTYLVEKAFEYIKEKNLRFDEYEFQMLYGVTPGLRDKIIAMGHNMRMYVPFGQDWFGYCSRRMKENPKMVGDIVKAIFIRG